MYTIALAYFGYTEDEARFLYLVATHSGYFTCQQFIRFIRGKPGKRSLSFVRKLLEKGHASAHPCLRNGKVYHLFARNLYEAIGKDNVRFRRKHSIEYIRTRLAALDFILARLDYLVGRPDELKNPPPRNFFLADQTRVPTGIRTSGGIAVSIYFDVTLPPSPPK
jgi:hypothetical protein